MLGIVDFTEACPIVFGTFKKLKEAYTFEEGI